MLATMDGQQPLPWGSFQGLKNLLFYNLRGRRDPAIPLVVVICVRVLPLKP